MWTSFSNKLDLICLFVCLFDSYTDPPSHGGTRELSMVVFYAINPPHVTLTMCLRTVTIRVIRAAPGYLSPAYVMGVLKMIPRGFYCVLCVA